MNLLWLNKMSIMSSTGKIYALLLGVVLISVGQGLMREPQLNPHFQPLANIVEHWNTSLYLSLNNPFNTLMGLFLIVLGAAIYGWTLISPNHKPSPPEILTSGIQRENWRKSVPLLAVSLGIFILILIQLANHQYSKLLFWGWLAAIFILTYLFWKNEHRSDILFSQLDIALMMILFGFAVFVGSFLLNDLPAGWIADEGPFWTTARSIALGELDPSFFDTGVFTFPIASSILQGWIMRWAGVDLWGWRFTSVLPAAATTIPLYLLAKELFDRRVAIAASMFMATSTYFLCFARLGYNNSQTLFPVTLCIYFLVIGFRKNNFFYIWLAGIAAGFGFYTYFAAWLGLVVLVIVAAGVWLISRKKLITGLLPAAVSLTGALVVLLPRIVYGLSSDTPVVLHYKIWETGPINSFYGKSVFGDERIAQANTTTIDNVEIFYDPQLYGILLLRGIIRSATILFDPMDYKDHQIIMGLAGKYTSLFFVVGLAYLFANFRRFQYAVPLIWFLAGFFFLGALSSLPPRPTHMVAMIPVLALITGAGLVYMMDTFFHDNSEEIRSTQSIKRMMMISIVGAVTILGLFQYFYMNPIFYFSPNQDDYISWLGRQIPHSANLFIANHLSSTRNPIDESLIKLTKHKVVILTSEELEKNPAQVETWKNFIAFISVQGGNNYAERLAGQIPSAEIQPGYAPGKRLRGYVISDLQISANMDVILSRGIKDLVNSSAFTIIALCFAGAAILLVRQWDKW